jgi:biopolymer transport protein ExbB/TolQ
VPLTVVTPVLAAADTGYIIASVVVAAVVLLVYLLIVAVRVRNAAERLDELEQRIARQPAGEDEIATVPPEVAPR